ncbi:hypothetical protein NDU88_006825 [Pleurodeles waltl]|uniref:Ig-like domain-containing protein n=1 Tax=Pleurodeles waltl TaxID=8319 RepID=A0AAV7LY20_PLEWA|nr:hypothetical protein NDU88_006825 [Pleurodeles waltl]
MGDRNSSDPVTMSCALLLLVLSAYTSCSVAQDVVTQSPSVSVPPGQSVTLSCTKTSSSNSFHWYQQKPGGAPWFVWCDSSTRGPGIPDRFSGSTSGTTGTLQVSNAQPEDDAVYYCCVWDGTGAAYHSDTAM